MPKYKEIQIDTTISNLARFAKKQGVNYKMLKQLNPWLRTTSMPDKSRNDYKEVKINYKNNLVPYQNSGLSYISRKWLLKKISNNVEGKDLDDILFEDQNSITYSILKTEILDGGTPDRLSYMRGAIN